MAMGIQYLAGYVPWRWVESFESGKRAGPLPETWKNGLSEDREPVWTEGVESAYQQVAD